MTRQWHWWLLLVGCVATGCGETTPERPKLRVAAASDLQEAMPVLASVFRQDHDVEIVATFGASGQLAEQVRQGAPFDLFLSANRGFVEKLASQGHLDPASVKPYARGTLALAVNKLWGVKVKGLSDLTRPEVHKIAIANTETAPYGMAAKQALERAGLWESLKPRLVPAESVRQVLQFVQTGNAEVGLVSRSISEIPEAEIIPLPLDSCDPIIQVLGVVKKSGRMADAGAFANFVVSDVGQGILSDLGFLPAKFETTPPAEKNEPRASK